MKLVSDDLKSKGILITEKSGGRVKGRASKIVVVESASAKRERLGSLQVNHPSNSLKENSESATTAEEIFNTVKPLSVVPCNPRKGKYTLIPSPATFFVGVGPTANKDIGEKLIHRQQTFLPDIYLNFPANNKHSNDADQYSQENLESKGKKSTHSKRRTPSSKRRGQIRALSARLKSQRDTFAQQKGESPKKGEIKNTPTTFDAFVSSKNIETEPTLSAQQKGESPKKVEIKNTPTTFDAFVSSKNIETEPTLSAQQKGESPKKGEIKNTPTSFDAIVSSKNIETEPTLGNQVDIGGKGDSSGAACESRRPITGRKKSMESNGVVENVQNPETLIEDPAVVMKYSHQKYERQHDKSPAQSNQTFSSRPSTDKSVTKGQTPVANNPPRKMKSETTDHDKTVILDGSLKVSGSTKTAITPKSEPSEQTDVKTDESKNQKISIPENFLKSPDNIRPQSKSTITMKPGITAARMSVQPVATNRNGGLGENGYVKRGRPRATTIPVPSTAVNQRPVAPPPRPKSQAAKDAADEMNSDMQNDDEDDVPVEELPKPPPLPPNARVPPCITDPSVFPYDATVTCIRTLNKNPLDIDYGAWHRNVVPTLSQPMRNNSTGLRYTDRPNVFYLGKGNNSILMENHLTKRLGWKRIEEKGTDEFKLKWVQCNNQIDFEAFRDYEQLVNHIPNISCLTTKIGLVESLRAYERHLSIASSKKHNASLDQNFRDFFSETYRLSNRAEFAQFRETYKEGEVWICKPNGLNQGIGIYLIRSLQELDEKLSESQQRNSKIAVYKQRSHIHDRMIQRYIEKPLLLNNKKIDIRCYMLIACTSPFVVLYHPGYLRLCLEDYKIDDTCLTGHLNNQYIQKKDPRYKSQKESILWSLNMANDYINEHYMKEKNIEKDWWFKVFERKVKRIMLHCFQAVKCTLKQRLGYFELLGFDFMIDENMKVWLIEINCNPALATNCQVLDQVIPPMINETLDITLEIWEKVRRGQSICPIQSRQNMEVLFNESNNYSFIRGNPVRRSPTNMKPSTSNATQSQPQSLNSARTSNSPNRAGEQAG